MKLRQMKPTLSEIRDDHVARYQFAIDQLSAVHFREPILDVGCGVGYGSKMMADQLLDAVVYAIDIDKGAIDYAVEHYSSEFIMYLISDLSRNGPGPPADYIKAITMFEVIEHSVDAPDFLNLCVAWQLAF